MVKWSIICNFTGIRFLVGFVPFLLPFEGMETVPPNGFVEVGPDGWIAVKLNMHLPCFYKGIGGNFLCDGATNPPEGIERQGGLKFPVKESQSSFLTLLKSECLSLPGQDVIPSFHAGLKTKDSANKIGWI